MKIRRLRWPALERGKLKTKLLCVYFLLVVLPLGLYLPSEYPTARATS